VIARLGLALLFAGLAGCATTDRVILLPDDVTGKVGKINVIGKGGGEVLLDSAYGQASAGAGEVRGETLDADTVRQRYAHELAGLPPRPAIFLLYFLNDSDELTAESQALLPAILKEVAQRPAPEVVVIGHTDRVGAVEYNDKLSLQRAGTVRDKLVAAGLDRAHIEVAGRGEREPLVPTEDEVAEPRNRRVEISVR
jgi:outer membrane protein OmpA-like peptidoglycan-associated protein